MRLLETKSYELFEASDIPAPFPSYAILSHTWISSKDEITYQDMKTRKGDIKNDVYKQKGWSKLKKYCDRAAKDGWEWAWMDTCCIDKTNPADTQEAINAMFRWYQSAGICYAHLEDVDVLRDVKDMDLPQNVDFDGTVGSRNAANPNGPLHKALERFFIKAKWFTRGWTLQELLAPHYLVFVDPSKSGWGILARSVKDFWDASKVKALGHYGNTFSMTNQGLAITAKHWRHKADLNAGLIRLNCSIGSDSSQETGIYLTYDADADAYHRIRIHQLCDMSRNSMTKEHGGSLT
ncbi:hypothetical protein BHE90_001662 [Fusarium euwallaceae]|uniref:Heterokaryon incompatibility domain-containing protein n=1 Tax=Fusarium euwallaceae TaxID=1147111 RepID=A0A430M793_9HYPO|nr:hypothetical protein BHE90_001662 [Fusarium euwallaceae]